MALWTTATPEVAAASGKSIWTLVEPPAAIVPTAIGVAVEVAVDPRREVRMRTLLAALPPLFWMVRVTRQAEPVLIIVLVNLRTG